MRSRERFLSVAVKRRERDLPLNLVPEANHLGKSSSRTRTSSKTILRFGAASRLLGRYAGDGSLGDLVAARLWTAERKFTDLECLFVDSRAFDMPVFQAQVAYGAIR